MYLTKTAGLMRAALTGAGIGGALGGAKGLYESHGDNMFQSGNRIESTLKGMGMGAGLGALGGAGVHYAKPLWGQAQNLFKGKPPVTPPPAAGAAVAETVAAAPNIASPVAAAVKQPKVFPGTASLDAPLSLADQARLLENAPKVMPTLTNPNIIKSGLRPSPLLPSDVASEGSRLTQRARDNRRF